MVSGDNSFHVTRDASGDHYEPRGHFFMDVEDRSMEGGRYGLHSFDFTRILEGFHA